MTSTTSLGYLLHYWSLFPHVMSQKCKSNFRICQQLLGRVLKPTQEMRFCQAFPQFLFSPFDYPFFGARSSPFIAGDRGPYPDPSVLPAVGAVFIFGLKAATSDFQSCYCRVYFWSLPGGINLKCPLHSNYPYSLCCWYQTNRLTESLFIPHFSFQQPCSNTTHACTEILKAASPMSDV